MDRRDETNSDPSPKNARAHLQSWRWTFRLPLFILIVAVFVFLPPDHKPGGVVGDVFMFLTFPAYTIALTLGSQSVLAAWLCLSVVQYALIGRFIDRWITRRGKGSPVL